MGVLHLGRVPDEELATIRGAATGSEVSYTDVGGTLRPDGPGGRHPAYTRTRPVGHGQAAFAGAVRGLRQWAPQRSLGARVHPADAPLTTGTTVLIVLRFGPFEIVVPDRIVVVVDEPGRFGFAYGTLPGHAERGEESFVVRLEPDGAVTATVTVVAGPASRLLAVAGPVLRYVQHRAVDSYLGALERAAGDGAAAGDGRP